MAITEYLEHASLPKYSLAIVAALVVYSVGLGIYRLYLSPLSKFPGPKLAALTLWYEFYYDVIKRGRFAWEIKRMHEIYGPIVRINPYELHVSEPDFYDELFTGASRKRDKYQWSADMFNIRDSTISTVDHELHRRRRAPLNPYFSRQAITKFEPVIKSKVETLCARLREFEKSGQPVNIEDAATALTTDIVTQYAFGISYDYLLAPDFSQEWPRLMRGASEQTLIHKQMPWLTKIMEAVPLEIVAMFIPTISQVITFQNRIKDRVAKAKSEEVEGKDATIFHGLLASDLPASELSDRRLQGEAQTVVAAGALTTAHFLKAATYYIVANPAIYKRLQAEFDQAIPNLSVFLPFHELDRLPYFNAVINEVFRMNHGVIARVTRVAPNEDLHFHEWTIKPGTPVGMSSWLIHLNPELFPDPETFKPERWLEPGAERLTKYLVNFTKGSRICLGKELARTEIVYTLSTLFRRYDMELFETDRSDVEIVHDFFNPFPKLDSKGVRVMLKSRG